MKLLIAGSGSPAARELATLLRQGDVPHVLIPDRLLETEDPAQLREFCRKQQPDQLVNLNSFRPTSQLALFRAESELAACQQVQQKQPAMLRDICEEMAIPMIHVSTCYVFDGEKKLGYNEQDDANPLGVYGQTALRGEQEVARWERHLIVRLGWLFGRTLHDQIRLWIKTCKKNQGALELVQRRFSPTPVEDAARVLLAICRQVDCDASVWGTYHYCGLETKKESEFAQQALKYASLHDEQIYQYLESFRLRDGQVKLPEIANGTLSSKKIFDTFGIKQRSWHGSLQAAIKSIYQSRDQDRNKGRSGANTQLPDTFASRRLH